MENPDVLVVGGGISGLAFAWAAAAAGRSVLVLEQAQRLGGCIETHRTPQGFWFELGAHTAYNSYAGLLEIIDSTGLTERITARAKVPFRLLRDHKLLSVMQALDKWEALRSIPRILYARKDGQTVRGYFSRVVGKNNYERVLGPFLSAVPSQSPDAFPAAGPGSLFKKRARRKDVVRHFTLEGGLSAVVEAVAARPGVAVQTGVEVEAVEPAGAGFSVSASGGRRFSAGIVALAVPPPLAAAILGGAFRALGDSLRVLGTVRVDTVGVAVGRDKTALPQAAFIVPASDVFYSIVTRDVVPDERFRAFTFHFRPGLDRETRLGRVAEVLGVSATDLVAVAEKHVVLPSPAVDHGAAVAAIERALVGQRVAIAGNFFAGMAIEDCVQRSKAEWSRVTA